MDDLERYREWVNTKWGRYPGGSEADWLEAMDGMSHKQIRDCCQKIVKRKVRPEYHMDVFLSKKKQPLSDQTYMLLERRCTLIPLQADMRKHRPHLYAKTSGADSQTWDSSKKQISLEPPSVAA